MLCEFVKWICWQDFKAGGLYMQDTILRRHNEQNVQVFARHSFSNAFNNKIGVHRYLSTQKSNSKYLTLK